MTLSPVSFKKGRAHERRLSDPYVPGRHSGRYWTEAQDQIIRDHYPAGGLLACAIRLPKEHATKSAIYARAQKLGVKSLRKGGGPKQHRHDYGPEMDDRIRAAWPLLDAKKKGVVNALADELGVPRWWLSDRARRLGLKTVVHKKEPPWTAAEDELMERVSLHGDCKRAAEIFREHGFCRSATAILVRAQRLNLSRRYSDTLSAHAAARILGVDDKSITALCISGDLKASKRETRRLPQQGGCPWSIRREDLRQYVIDFVERIDLRKVDKVAFVDLLVNFAETDKTAEASAA